MSRYSFWGRAVDTFGNITPNTGITVYDATTSTASTIYKNQVGGIGISTAPQVTTDETGRFNFWLDDNDYAISQLFDIIVGSLVYTKVDIFRAAQIDSTSISGAIADEVETQTAGLSAASREQDQRVREYVDISIFNVSAASDEKDQRVIEYVDITTVNISAASREQDNRLQEQIDLIDPESESVSAASREQDNRLHEITDVLRVDVEDVDGQLATHLASASVHFFESDIELGNIGVSAHAHPRYDQLDTTSLSAASREQDQRLQEQVDSIESPSGNIINRANEYTDVQITSVSAGSDEKDQRLLEVINAVSAASLEQDNRLLQSFVVSGTGIYSQFDKFAIEMEMEFKAAQQNYYKELTYLSTGTLAGSLVDIDIYTDSTKVLQLFHKDLYYNLDDNLSRTLLLRNSDLSQVAKYLTYNVSDQLINIEVSAYNVNQYSKNPGGISDETLSVSAASDEKDQRLQEQIDAIGIGGSPSGSIINRANEYTDYRVNNLTLPTSASLDDLHYEISNLTLPTSASLEDVQDVDGQLATHLASGSVHFLESEINFHNIGISAHGHPTSYSEQGHSHPAVDAASDRISDGDNIVRTRDTDNLVMVSAGGLNVTEFENTQIMLGSSSWNNKIRIDESGNAVSISGGIINLIGDVPELNDIRYDLNTFTIPNSASLDDLHYELSNLTLPTSASLEDVQDVDGQLATHLASAGVHFLETEIDFDNLATSAHSHPQYDAHTDITSVSAASVEQDKRLQEQIDNRIWTSAAQSIHDNLQNELNTFTLPNSASLDDLHYELSNLTLPTSASLEDVQDVDGQLATHLASGSVHFLESDIDFDNLATSAHSHPQYDAHTDITSVSAASDEKDQRLQEQIEWRLATSAAQIDHDDLRYDINTFTSPNSASLDDLHYEFSNLTLPTSASIEDLDDIRRDVNTFTSPNSASLDDLHYEFSNLTLPTSASIEDLDDIRYDLNTFSSPNSASQDDLTYEIHNLTLPTSASLEDIDDVRGRIRTHNTSASVHFELSNDLLLEPDPTIAVSEKIIRLHTLQLSGGVREALDHLTFYQSTLHENFNAFVKPNGNGSSLVVSAADGSSTLTAFFQDGHTELTIPASGLSIRLNPGSRTVPKGNFIYIDGTTKELTLQSGGESFPQTELTKVAYLFLLDDDHTTSAGALINQNWNDELHDTVNGHLSHITENIRLTMGGSHWHSGVTPTINITTNGGEEDNVNVSTTSGVAYQMHRHLLSAQDTSTGSVVYIVNDSTTPYKTITDLNNLLTDATGASMTDRYFNLVVWGVGNKTGQFSPLLVNLPGGSYFVEENAINDVDGYDVYNMPHAFNQDSSTGFLIARFTFKHSSAQFGTWTLENTSDLRGLTPGIIAGAGGIGQTDTEFTDTQFKILDDGDTSKTFQFEASTIATATNRTLTVQDSDGTIALISNLDVLQNELNTFTIPNSASLDDLHYEISNLTLPTSASLDDLHYELSNLILPTSASQSDIVSVSAASREQDQRLLEQIIPPSAAVVIGQDELSSGITSAAIIFAVEQSDQNYTISTEIINTIDNPPSIYSSVIIKKGFDEFRILFSGSLDSDNYKLDWTLLR